MWVVCVLSDAHHLFYCHWMPVWYILCPFYWTVSSWQFPCRKSPSCFGKYAQFLLMTRVATVHLEELTWTEWKNRCPRLFEFTINQALEINNHWGVVSIPMTTSIFSHTRVSTRGNPLLNNGEKAHLPGLLSPRLSMCTLIFENHHHCLTHVCQFLTSLLIYLHWPGRPCSEPPLRKAFCTLSKVTVPHFTRAFYRIRRVNKHLSAHFFLIFHAAWSLITAIYKLPLESMTQYSHWVI